MNSKSFVCAALVGILVGCSKKEDTATPPMKPVPTPNAETNLKSTLNDVATNVQGAATAAVTNSISTAKSIVADATNNAAAIVTTNVTAAQSAFSSFGNSLKSTAQDAVTSATNIVAPSTVSGIAVTNVTTATVAPATPSAPASSTASSVSLASLASLSTDQVSQGLKEALGKGLQQAVSSLGQPGGFMTNVNVKIPLPTKLQSVEKGLRAIGQGQLADQSIATMNQAAEQAVPLAADVFANGLKNMSIEDAKAILSGAPDAATQFFRRTTETELRQKFSPIVQQSMTKCGATAAYEQLLGKAQSVSPLFTTPSLDLNAYVTDKALDGLFKMVADEEKQIRANPVARSTDLLKSVFGAASK